MIAWIVNSFVFILILVLTVCGFVIGAIGIARVQIKPALIGLACLGSAAILLTTFITFVIK